MRHRALLVCLWLSGAAGLAYELLWTRLLALSFGSTTLSLSTVLAVFFGGVGLGSWIAGKRAGALATPIRTYARLELGIALFALGLYPSLKHLGSVFAFVGPHPVLQFIIASLLLAAPTVLLGATLPVACSALVQASNDPGKRVALVYGITTIGAFFGAYLVTYYGLPSLGIFFTLTIAIGASLLAAFIAYRASSSPGSTRDESSLPSTEVTGPLRLAACLTLASGIVFSGFEVVWSRLFSSFLGGTVYGVGAVLICFLVGMGIGSLVLARLIPANEGLGVWFAVLQTLAVAAIVLLASNLDALVFFLGTVGLSGPEGGNLVSRHLQLLIIFVALLIPTMASGASFPLLIKRIVAPGHDAGYALGAIYGANTVGAIIGAFATGFFLIPELGSDGAVGILVVLTGLSAALGGALLSEGSARGWGAAIGFVGILLVAGYDGIDGRLVITGAPRGESLESFREYHESVSERLVYFSEGRDAHRRRSRVE